MCVWVGVCAFCTKWVWVGVCVFCEWGCGCVVSVVIEWVCCLVRWYLVWGGKGSWVGWLLVLALPYVCCLGLSHFLYSSGVITCGLAALSTPTLKLATFYALVFSTKSETSINASMLCSCAIYVPVCFSGRGKLTQCLC